MSGDAKRRFPRTTRAMPQAGPTIEREKIRRRQPNDMVLDDGAQPVEAYDEFADDAEDAFIVGDEEDYWDQGEADHADEPAWDDEPDDEWGDEEVFAPSKEEILAPSDDESGVVWDDQGEPVETDDGIVFDNADGGEEWAPEVELAGRRDVRPKRPRPAPEPRAENVARGARRASPADPAPRQGQASSSRPRPHRPPPTAGLAEPEAVIDSLPSKSFGFSTSKAVTAGAARGASPAQSERFTRTRATMDPATSGRSGGEQVLDQPRQTSSRRRRKSHITHNPPTLRNRRGEGGWGKRIALVAAVLLLALGGWLIYPTIGTDGVGGAFTRLVEALPLPGSNRTANDTAFGQTSTEEPITAQEALSHLEEQARAQGGPANALSDPEAIDPATVGTLGPPIPKLKPPLAATRSLSAADELGGDEQAQLASGGRDAGDEGEPSFLEQIWRYLSPG